MTDTLTSDPSLLADAERLLEPAVEMRRDIHAHPELGLHLPRTQARVIDALAELGLRTETGSSTTSVVAVLEGDRPGPTTLLRADMDALPMPEETGLGFASTVDGVMHACGHDTHVAMLVGAARLLSERRAQLGGRVVLMFQPGEEGHGGAKVMLDEGLSERFGPFDRAFAIHATPMIPPGVVATRPGPMLASADAYRIVVTGKGGHASMPHDTVDPVPVACEIVTALQAMVTRRVPAFDPAVVTVASVQAGTTSNVIPETAILQVTLRAVSEASRELVLDGLARVAANVAAAHLCTADLELAQVGYPVTINDETAVARTVRIAEDLLGAHRVLHMPSPVMGAEDWSFVLQQVPGAMVFLGMRPPGEGQPAPNHSNRMMLDETAMATGIALHAAVALGPAVTEA